MLPGETVVHRFHPSAWSQAGLYAAGAQVLVCAGLLAVLLHSHAWRAGSQGSGWMFWNYLYGNAAVAGAAAALVLAVACVSLLSVARSPHAYVLASGLACLGVVLVAALVHAPYATTLPWTLAVAGAAMLAAAEANRRASWILVTSLRIVQAPGPLRRGEWQARLADIVDLDTRQGPLAKRLGTGTLVTVLRAPEPVFDALEAPAPAQSAPHVEFAGVHPFTAVRELVEVLVQEATASLAIQAQARTRERKAAVLAKLQAAQPALVTHAP